LTFRNPLLFICLIGSLSLFSNSHTKQYEVLFPSGSSFISTNIQEQVVKIYNQIPELQYSRIKCKGLDDALQSNVDIHILARSRAKNIQEIFLLFGMAKKHVKMSFGTVPMLLVFKPRARLLTSSMVTEELSKHKASHTVQADKKSYLVSSHNHLYVFAAHSFETENGVVVKNGTIDIALTELCTNDHVVKCGVAGKQNIAPQEFGMYFNIEATQSGKKLNLRIGYIYKVLVNATVVAYDMSPYKGSVIDEVMVWRKNRGAKIHKKFLSKEEVRGGKKTMNMKLIGVKEGYKTELILNTLGWNKCSKIHVHEESNKVLMSLVFSAKHAVYLISNKSKMIIPAFENLNFKDLYEFPEVPKNESFQLVAIPINTKIQTYVYESDINASVKYSNPQISSCAGNSSYNCIQIK
jgi:hypothetical protein